MNICDYCRYRRYAGYADVCAKDVVRVRNVYPEGLTINDEQRGHLSCTESLSAFRQRNNGSCPYFKRELSFIVVWSLIVGITAVIMFLIAVLANLSMR